MSATTGDFTAVLRQVGRGLALPLQDRVRILRELSYDLEELSQRFVAQGLSAEEARLRATEALVPQGHALDQLDWIHTPWYRRATRGVTPDRLRMAERGALALASAAVLVVEGVALRRVDLFGDPSPFMVPVLVAGAALFALVLAKAFQLFVKGDHAVPSRGLGTILGASAVTLAVGVGGFLVDLLRLVTTLEASPELAGALVPPWVAGRAILLTVALFLSFAGALGWFVLRQWIAIAEGAQDDVLGFSRTQP